MIKLALLPLLSLMLCVQAFGQSVQPTLPTQPTRVRVRGMELHYIERGKGEPLILLHGGQGDYRFWEAQIKSVSPHFRVIS